MPKKKAKPHTLTYLQKNRKGETASPDKLKEMAQVSFERRVVVERMSDRDALLPREGESFSVTDRLSPLLQWVRRFPQQNRFERIGAKLRDNPSPFHRIQYCSQAFLSGALPDAETLEFVAVAFDKYVNSDGTLSLDEAFKLKAKPKAGNPAKQFATQNKMNGFLLSMATALALRPKLSQEKAAGSALGTDESIPVNTLVREYRRRPKIARWVETMRGKLIH